MKASTLRLAVFVNQFPGRVSTFFARDIRGLLSSGVHVEVFPIYPLDGELWRYVPDILNESVLPKRRIHHISLGQSLRFMRPRGFRKLATFLCDSAAISASAAKYGAKPLIKSMYVFLKAWGWAQRFHDDYDQILAYWGNYAASCAYIYHRLTAPQIPFSIFLHAGMDLYRNPVYMRQKLLYADNIIVCSEFNRQFIQDQFPEIHARIGQKIFVHHHGLDFSEFPYEPNKRASSRVIAVGRFEKHKGFDNLLHAMHMLGCRGIKIEVELIGDGQQAAALKALANSLHIGERVKFRGWLTFNEVQTAMGQATVLVHSSPDLGDGVPNVIKEAMAIGTPIIASHVAGIPELLGNGTHGVLVPPQNIEALANAIESLLADDSMRTRYADAARKYAEHKFDLWQNGLQLARLLESTQPRNKNIITS